MKYEGTCDLELNVNDAFCPCVYFLLKGDEVVYVGKTTNGIGRVFAHMKEKDFDNIKIKRMPIDELDLAEARYISKYNPRYNVVMPYLSNSARIKKILLDKHGVRAKKRAIDYWIITRGIDFLFFNGDRYITPWDVEECIKYFTK